jgi:(1->4)-alpha-D-glucan 1-alpha-D-glucosylmutase
MWSNEFSNGFCEANAIPATSVWTVQPSATIEVRKLESDNEVARFAEGETPRIGRRTMIQAQLVETLLEQTRQFILRRRRFPEATYRLQFHNHFTFRDAERIVPYLDDLGVTDCYASPYLKARPGSLHGYDIQDHRQLNPEIGTEENYQAFITALQEHRLGQLFDMVPNHMGIVGNENVWWNDVLENGPASPYAGFFDINWFSYKPALHECILLPILGEPYGKVLEARQLSLHFEAGVFSIYYFDHHFPVSPCTYLRILEHRLPELEHRLPADSPALMEYHSIVTAIRHLPPRSVADPAKIAERTREKEVIKRRLATLVQESAPVRDFIAENVVIFNGRPDDPSSLDLLDDLLNRQAYRLAWWHVAADEINYRRFFDINELAALSMERPEVFAATHELILRLLREGKITGLRIDHPDGLYNPKQYLERLQQHYALECAHAVVLNQPEFRNLDWKEIEEPLFQAIRTANRASRDSFFWRPLYVVVEKILSRGEPMPDAWPVYGTTGYEFLNALNGLFVDASHVNALTRIFRWWTKTEVPYRDLVYQKKFLILQASLSGELHMLAHQLDRLAQSHRWSRDFTLNSLRHALREIIASFPVYRSYLSEEGIPRRDPYYLVTAVLRAKRKNPTISAAIFDFVRDLLLQKHADTAGEQERADQLRFAGKFQQVTAPVMAKGLEDTTFYVFNRLISLNEVGGDPEQFGVTVPVLHEFNQDRQRHWPWALSATSTHDTKRSEDVRARIDVLSELPREWQRQLMRWNTLNERHRVLLESEEVAAPDRNEEYLLYQTLLGAWPLEPYTGEEYATFITRIQAYMHKAAHEAKVHTSWTNPNAAYDEALRQFIGRILDPKVNPRFMRTFRAFQRRVSHYGLFNALSQVLLKITAPGVPDIYQGMELWDLSLVDPDNRRPVAYDRRRQLLNALKECAANASRLPELCKQLTEQKEDGRIKLFITYRALNCRRDHRGLFSQGEYEPLQATGVHETNVFGFVRRHNNQRALVIAPRLFTSLLPTARALPLGPEIWRDTALVLPETERGASFRNVFTGEPLKPQQKVAEARFALSDVLRHFPVALLVAEPA